MKTVANMLGVVIAFCVFFAMPFLAPGSALVQMQSLETDGQSVVLTRTVTWPVDAVYSEEVEDFGDADVHPECNRLSRSHIEARDENPVRWVFPCALPAGSYVYRLCVAPTMWGVQMRQTCRTAAFTVREP